MIGSLRGRLLDRGSGGEVLIEVAGIGYRVQTGPVTAARLGDVDREVFVWIHQHVREDLEALYGFVTRDERATFETLLGARGVGPALALAIMSIHAPDELARIVAEEDDASLCLVPGIGKKTAARLLIELKNKLDHPITTTEVGPTGGSGGGAGPRADVRHALGELGFTPDEIAAATRELPDTDADQMLKEALRRLAGAR